MKKRTLIILRIILKIIFFIFLFMIYFKLGEIYGRFGNGKTFIEFFSQRQEFNYNIYGSMPEAMKIQLSLSKSITRYIWVSVGIYFIIWILGGIINPEDNEFLAKLIYNFKKQIKEEF